MTSIGEVDGLDRVFFEVFLSAMPLQVDELVVSSYQSSEALAGNANTRPACLYLAHNVAHRTSRHSSYFSHHIQVANSGLRRFFFTDQVTSSLHSACFAAGLEQSPTNFPLTLSAGREKIIDHPRAKSKHLPAMHDPNYPFGKPHHCVLHSDRCQSPETGCTQRAVEAELRQSIGLLLAHRDALRARLSDKQILSPPWRKGKLLTCDAPPESTWWAVGPASKLMTTVCTALGDEVTGAKLRSADLNQVALLDAHKSTTPVDTRLDCYSGSYPGSELLPYELEPAFPGSQRQNGPCISYPVVQDGNEPLATASNKWGSALRRGLLVPGLEQRKRQRSFLAKERRALQETRRDEKLARHLPDRLNRERERELDRLGRLLRRAAELDVTRCCNDVRTLLHARWQCEEAHLLVGDPPSVSGDSESARDIALAHVTKCTQPVHSFFFREVMNTTKIPFDRVILELSDLLFALSPIARWDLWCVPNALELWGALQTQTTRAVVNDRCRIQMYSRSMILLHSVAKGLVHLLLPSLCRLFNVDRCNCVHPSLHEALPINDLTWPCVARLALLTCAYREVGASEVEMLSEMRGAVSSWVQTPAPGSPDHDVQALLQSRADFSFANWAEENTMSKWTTCQEQIRIRKPTICAWSRRGMSVTRLTFVALGACPARESAFVKRRGELLPLSRFENSVRDTLKNIAACVVYRTDCNPQASNSPELSACAASISANDTFNSQHCEAIMHALLQHSEAHFLTAPVHDSYTSRTGTTLFEARTLTEVQSALRSGTFDGSMALFVNAVRRVLFMAEIFGVDSSESDMIAGRLLAKFEALVRHTRGRKLQEISSTSQLSIGCPACERTVAFNERSQRCRRCNIAYHLNCLCRTAYGEFIQSIQDEQRLAPWFCPSCAGHTAGPGPTDGLVGSTLVKNHNGVFEVVGTIERVVGTRSLSHSLNRSLQCTFRPAQDKGSEMSLTVQHLSLVHRKNCYSNAGWGIPAGIIPHKLNPLTGANALKHGRCPVYSALLDASAVLAEGMVPLRKNWLTLFKGFVHAISCSHDFYNLLIDLNELAVFCSRSKRCDKLAMLRLRPRIVIAGFAEISKEESCALDLDVPLFISSFKEPHYARLHTGEKERDSSSRSLAATHLNTSLIKAQEDPLDYLTPDLESECEPCSSCTGAMLGHQDRRKLKEVRLVGRVIQSAAVFVELDTLELGICNDCTQLREQLISAAEKGLVTGTSSGGNSTFVEVPYESKLEERVPCNQTAQEPMATLPCNCALCGGDFDYLNSELQPTLHYVTPSLFGSDEGISKLKCGDSIWALKAHKAHEFCIEARAQFQTGAVSRTKSRSSKTHWSPLLSRARTTPVGIDSMGSVYWHFACSFNTLYVERVPALTGSSAVITSDLVGIDEVPHVYRVMHQVADFERTDSNTRLLNALGDAFPEALAMFSATCDAETYRYRNHVFETIEISLTLRDLHPCYLEGQEDSTCLASCHNPGSSVCVRGVGVLWRAQVKRVKAADDSLFKYFVQFTNWSTLSCCWLNKESMILQTQVARLSQTALYRSVTASSMLCSPGWVFVAGLKASEFVGAPYRYCNVSSFSSMSLIHTTTRLHGEVEQVQAVLIAIEAALPIGSKHKWCKSKCLERIHRIDRAVEVVQVVELLLQLEDEVQTTWLDTQWASIRAQLPSRQYLLRHASPNWAALLAWNIDRAVMYDKINAHDGAPF